MNTTLINKLIDEGYANDEEHAARIIENAYLGVYESLKDYAYEYIESTGILDNCDELVSRYFDYYAFVSDLELGGDVITVSTNFDEVHVFDAHSL